MTCTFLIILVQFFCNKKYNCPKPDVSPESSCYETDNEIEVPKPKKKKKKDQTNIPMEKKDLPKNKKKVSIPIILIGIYRAYLLQNPNY